MIRLFFRLSAYIIYPLQSTGAGLTGLVLLFWGISFFVFASDLNTSDSRIERKAQLPPCPPLYTGEEPVVFTTLDKWGESVVLPPVARVEKSKYPSLRENERSESPVCKPRYPGKQRRPWNTKVMVWTYIGLLLFFGTSLPILLTLKILSTFWIAVAFWTLLILVLAGFIGYFVFNDRFDRTYKFLRNPNKYQTPPNKEGRYSKNFTTENKKYKSKPYKSATSRQAVRHQKRHRRTNWARKNRRRRRR